jgi:hypothetical protein
LAVSSDYRIYAVRYADRNHVPAWEAFHQEHAAPEDGMDYFVAITDGHYYANLEEGQPDEP